MGSRRRPQAHPFTPALIEELRTGPQRAEHLLRWQPRVRWCKSALPPRSSYCRRCEFRRANSHQLWGWISKPQGVFLPWLAPQGIQPSAEDRVVVCCLGLRFSMVLLLW